MENGFPFEQHNVTTEDGHILTMHRIPKNRLSRKINDIRARIYKYNNDKGQKLAKQETVNFHNLLADRSRMNDALGYRYFRMAGVPSPRTTFVDMTLEIDKMLPPSMLGLYLMVEKPDNKWLEDFFGKEGGAVFKPVTLTLFKYLSDNWADYAPVYGPKSDLTDAQ